MRDSDNKYQLEDRTAIFGEKIIDLCKRVKRDLVTDSIIDQLARSGLSIGANYCEANGASSRKDFKNKIYICKKEAKEAKYWLRMLARSSSELRADCRTLWLEAQELTMIFSKIAANTH